jgi:pyruvate/2-oxoglutarate dehydrogenase complex dihydrolipoamide acyltransferase (E2) component
MDVILPKWGMTMQEATIVRWLKAEGDSVEKDEPLVEVETDKVEVAVEAPVGGTLSRCVVSIGDVVPVGELLAVIEPE